MENNSWIIRNPGYRCSQTCSTSVPFCTSTGSKGHWILSNPDMEGRNIMLLVTGVAFSSSFDSGRSTAVVLLVVPGCQLHCWAVKSSCPTVAGPTEPCKCSPLGCSQALPPSQQLAFISIPPSSWACSCPLQQEVDLYGLDRDKCALGKLFHTLSWSHMGAARGWVCSTGHLMAARV